MSTVTIGYLFLGSGTMHRGQGLQVERREWSNGYDLFTWDLTPDGSENPTHLHPDYRGQVTIKGLFTQGLNTVVTLIVYGTVRMYGVCTYHMYGMQAPVTSSCFLGVFASNELPSKILSYPSGLIANTDTNNKPGQHWVAMF